MLENLTRKINALTARLKRTATEVKRIRESEKNSEDKPLTDMIHHCSRICFFYGAAIGFFVTMSTFLVLYWVNA